MVITYQGGESFKISQGERVIAVNPKSKMSADITLMSVGKAEDGKTGFVISGPGEYEVKEVFVKGFLSEAPDKRINTIYMMNIEGMNICFLGTLANAEVPAETKGELEDIDILFTPVSAYKLAVSLEPGVIIPMSYTSDSLNKFLKEAGEDKAGALDKLVVKKKDLEGKEGDIIVLKEE